MKIEKRIRKGLPQVGYAPYGQIHAHSTGNRKSTVQNEADHFHNKDINTGYYTHLVGNGRIIQLANVNRGAWDLGGGWNQWGYASVELIESHKTKAEFMTDYKLYVNLLRDLAKEAGIKIKVDSGELGIITHNYATYNQPGNASDHVDPYPYLAKWGISKSQFKKDVEKGFDEVNKIKNTAPRQTLKVEWFLSNKSSNYTKLVKYLKKEKLSYSIVKGKGTKVGIHVKTFAQDSGNKFKLEQFCADNNISYELTV